MPSGAPLTIAVYRTWAELRAAVGDWDALLESSSLNSAFLSWEWLTSWWEAFAPPGELMLVVVRDGTSVLASLPLYGQDFRRAGFRVRWLRLVGDGSWDAETLGLICRRGREDEVADAISDWLRANRREGDVLECNAMPATAAANVALRRALGEALSVSSASSRGFTVPLPASFDEYLSGLSRQMRAKILRERKRVNASFEVQVRRCETPMEMPEVLEQFFRLHQARWEAAGSPGGFGVEWRRRFYRLLAERLLPGGVDIWQLSLNGTPVAVEYGLRRAGTYSQLQSGYDPGYAGYSVLNVLRAYILERLIAGGMREYDFLVGDEPFKARWGARSTEYIALRVARPFSAGAAAVRMQLAVEAGRRSLRPLLPAAIWNAGAAIYRRLKPRVQSS